MATGVATLAFSPRAQGEIVYTSVWTPILPPANSKVNLVSLDLNNDGIVDFSFSNFRSASSDQIYGRMRILPQNGNAVWGAGTVASALQSGVKVGSSQNKFQAGHSGMNGTICAYGGSGYHYGSGGPWANQIRKYLGFKFTIDGEFHYGWARLTVADACGGIYAAISGYAYETEPNTPIVTGQENGSGKGLRRRPRASSEPGSLGSLAVGAASLTTAQEHDNAQK
jgi:hypothetical protein